MHVGQTGLADKLEDLLENDFHISFPLIVQIQVQIIQVGYKDRDKCKMISKS